MSNLANPQRPRTTLPAWTRWAIPAAIAVKLALLLYYAINKQFVMDEFQQFGQAKYLFNGLFDTIWPAKAVGYTLVYLPAHKIGWNADSMLLLGRLQGASMAFAVLVLVYMTARRLYDDWPLAALTALVCISFSNFIERGFRLRGDLPALVFAAAALYVVVADEKRRLSRIFLAGLLSGGAFLCTQKSIYFNLALGLALMADAAAARQWLEGVKRGATLVAGWTIPLIAYCLFFGGDGAPEVARNLFLGPANVAINGGDAYDPGTFVRFVLETVMRNFILYGLAFAGIALALRRFTSLAPQIRVALIFTFIVTLLVAAHNQPWPYVYLMAIPFLSLWPPYLLQGVDLKPGHLRLATLMLGLGIAGSFIRNVHYIDRSNTEQLMLIGSAEAMLTEPQNTYFDGMGMLPNRMEAPRAWLDAAKIDQINAEGRKSETYRALANRPPKMIIWTYRMDDIAETVEPLIEGRYVAVSPNIRLAGARLRDGETATIDLPVAGTYTLYRPDGSNGPSRIRINGKLRTLPVSFDAGPLTISIDTGEGDFLLLPQGLGERNIRPGPDNPDLFGDPYD